MSNAGETNTNTVREALKQTAWITENPSQAGVEWLRALCYQLCSELDHARERRPEKLPDERIGRNHKFTLGNAFKAYLNYGTYPDGRLGEFFIRVVQVELEKDDLVNVVHALLDTIAIMTSAALQRGIPLEVLVDKFSFVKFPPRGFTNNPNIPMAHSIVDYIFRWLGYNFLGGGDGKSVDAP